MIIIDFVTKGTIPRYIKRTNPVNGFPQDNGMLKVEVGLSPFIHNSSLDTKNSFSYELTGG